MAKSSSFTLGIACFAIAVAVAGATQFTVGGANGWSVPAAATEPFNTWAERTRFQVGDSLVFVYPKDQDSVLLVDPADYNACNTSSYVKKFDDGDTVFALDRAGTFFFISGVEASCRANEKLIVMVLAAGRNGTGGAPAPTTATAAPPPASPSPPPPSSATTTPPPPSSPAPNKAPTVASPPPASSASAPPPTTTPSAPPPASSPPAAPSSSTPPPPSVPAGAPQAPPSPSASSPAPSAHGATATNSTGAPSPPHSAGPKDKNGAALAVATGLASSLGASVLGYAMLAL